MSSKSTTFPDASELGSKLSDAASQAKGKVADLSRAAASKIDENRDAAAGGLDSVATTLHERADSFPGGEPVTKLAHSTANKLTTTAEYVRNHDVSGMMGDVEEVVKKNPGPSLFAAAIVGFLVGRAFTSND
jgi:ElaB/YqjD/DUF883 family membrane-anchored ribosome-binding protein